MVAMKLEVEAFVWVGAAKLTLCGRRPRNPTYDHYLLRRFSSSICSARAPKYT